MPVRSECRGHVSYDSETAAGELKVSSALTLNSIVLNPHRDITYELTEVCQKKSAYQITELTNETSNSLFDDFDQERLEHSVSPVHPNISPPCHCRPRSSVMTEDHSLAGEQTHEIGKESIKGDQCTSIFYTTACTNSLH